MKAKFKDTEIGMIPEDWDVKYLGDVSSKIIDCSHARKPEFIDKSELIFLEVNNIGEDGFLDLSERKFINKSDFDAWTKRLLPKYQDVILTKTGRVGAAAQIPENIKCCIGRNQVIVRANRDILDLNFLLSYFMSPNFRRELSRLELSGTILQSLHVKYFPNIRVPFPSLEEQRGIGKQFMDISKKAKLLQKQNKTLEAIGQAIFKHWFVDFEFPNGEGKPYKSSGGEMVFNEELGKEIPKGWEAKPLDQIANFLNGLALQKFPPEGDDFLPVIKIKELRQGITEQSDKASPNIDKKYVINDGDVLFSWSGTLMVVIWGEGKGALNQHLFKVTSDDFEKWFYYYWIKDHLRKFIGIAKDKTTTMGHIKRHHLTASKVLVPNDVILERMNEIMNTFIHKIIKNKLELRMLISLRDSLLPKLMSGEIRVNNLEAGIE